MRTTCITVSVIVALSIVSGAAYAQGLSKAKSLRSTRHLKK
jgi:hypothetical protein